MNTSSGFDAVLSEAALPGMNGHELASHLAIRYPGTKVIFVTAINVECERCPHAVQLAFQEAYRRLKIEFAYLKQLPPEYNGPRHIVTVGRRPNGQEECEERSGEAPSNDETARDMNVLRIYIVYAAETSSEVREPDLDVSKAIG